MNLLSIDKITVQMKIYGQRISQKKTAGREVLVFDCFESANLYAASNDLLYLTSFSPSTQTFLEAPKITLAGS